MSDDTPKLGKLNADFKAKWLAALRGGEYEQTIGALERPARIASRHQGFCCLGVACKISDIPTTHERGDLIMLPMFEPQHWWEVLPHEEWQIRSPAVMLNGVAMPLATLNDNGRSFKEIADLIEEQL